LYLIYRLQPVHLLYPWAYAEFLPPPTLSYLKHNPLQVNIFSALQVKLNFKFRLQAFANTLSLLKDRYLRLINSNHI
jgi:hypothetical protein